MITILLRTIKDRWRMLVAITLIGVLSQWMYIALYPTYQESFAESAAMFQNMPEAFKKVINMDSFSMDTLEKYLNMEMYSMFWLILTILFTLSLAGSAFAGAVEQETATLTAAQPIGRGRAFAGVFLANAAMFTVFNLFVNGAVLPLAALHGIDVVAGHYFVVGVVGELFGLTLLALATAVSTLLSDKGRVYMVLGGTLLVMYVLNVVSGIRENLEALQYASLFHYFNPYTALVQGRYDGTAILVFLGLTVIGLAVGWWRWRQRDLV